MAAQGACTNSAFFSQYQLPGTFAPIADFTLAGGRQWAVARERGVGDAVVGNLVSTDNFYDVGSRTLEWGENGVWLAGGDGGRGVVLCGREPRQAGPWPSAPSATICSPGRICRRQSGETTFTTMMEIALETAVRMEDR